MCAKFHGYISFSFWVMRVESEEEQEQEQEEQEQEQEDEESTFYVFLNISL